MDESDTPIEAAWERIENWLVENAPMTLLTLNGGATDKDFWACEAALGFHLPAEVAEAYRIHNGQPEGVLMYEAQLLPLSEIAAKYQQCLTNRSFWNPKWLPLTADEAGDMVCLDLSAPNGEAAGPVVTVQHTKNNGEFLTASFTEWLTNFASALEAGYYQWSEDFDGIVIV